MTKGLYSNVFVVDCHSRTVGHGLARRRMVVESLFAAHLREPQMERKRLWSVSTPPLGLGLQVTARASAADGMGGKGQMFASDAVIAGIHTVRARAETRVLGWSGVTSGDKGSDHDEEAGLDVHLGRRKVEVEAVSLIW